jgi:hypothetical protein
VSKALHHVQLWYSFGNPLLIAALTFCINSSRLPNSADSMGL